MTVIDDTLYAAAQAGCQAIFDKYHEPGGWQNVPLVELIETALAAQPENQGAPGVRTTGLITSWTHSEARTHLGQLVSFGGPKKDLAAIKAAIARVTSFSFPETHEANVAHGGYGSYTRYKVAQHKYAGGIGFIEAIEIHDPPDGRMGFVVHKYGPYSGTVFWEFDTMDSAVAAWEKCWGIGAAIAERLRAQPGFLRQVDCGALTPWFYAVGDQELIRDFAFPERVQDDSYFRFGRQFVVTEPDRPPTVKTCIGSRQLDLDGGHGRYSRSPDGVLVVYWDDGTRTEIRSRLQDVPRPLHESEGWVVEAIARFKELLAGATNQFEVQFLDGSRFVGSYQPADPSLRASAGRYNVVVNFSDGRYPKSGWFDFEPTTEHPHLLSFLQSKLSNIQSIEVVNPKAGRRRNSPRKWAGVFHSNTRLATLTDSAD